MSVLVRRLESADLDEAYGLAALAFGEPRIASSSGELPAQVPGRIWYGAYDSASRRLLGTAMDLTHTQWWGGREVAAADVAGVAVLPEFRGSGTARALLTTLLEGAHDRGALVSALYPTVSAPYAKAGWATAGELRTADLPTGMLPRNRSGNPALTVRPADPGGADQPAVLALYDAIARTRNGLLTRRDPPFGPDTRWPTGIDGITLVEDGTVEDGHRLVGYLSWVRGTGYRQEGRLEVPDLLALTADAAQELVAVLAGWRSVTPTVRLRPLAYDAATRVIPWESGLQWDARPWMHRPVDVAGAVPARGWPAARNGSVRFGIRDALAPWNAGGWALEVSGGEGRLVRTQAEPAVTLDVAGFALLWCGAATSAQVAEAGLLTGPADAAAGLDLLLPDTPAQLLDYF